LRLIAGKLATESGIALLPATMLDSFASYPISLAITAGTMVIVSLVLGFEPRGSLLHKEAAGWLQASETPAKTSDAAIANQRSNLVPSLLGLIVIGLGLTLSFAIFW
jgi:hypothetical protein